MLICDESKINSESVKECVEKNVHRKVYKVFRPYQMQVSERFFTIHEHVSWRVVELLIRAMVDFVRW